MSLDAAAPIILLDTESGQRVPVWAELDHSSDFDPVHPHYTNATGSYPRMLMIWPAAQLTAGRRYIVALRGLVQEDGEWCDLSVG